MGRALLLCVVCGLGCDRPASPHPNPPASSTSLSVSADAPYRLVSHEGAEWIVATLDLSRVKLMLVGQAPSDPTTLQALLPYLAQRSLTLVMATNAGIFSPERRPMGLCIQDGKELAALSKSDGEGNFFLKPNGVFWLDEKGAHVASTGSYAPQGKVELATQSGPILVEKGIMHPSFQPGSESLRTRSAVGVNASGHVVVALSKQRVSFYSAAMLFRDVLGCADALYLDGEISDITAPTLPPAKGREYGGILVGVRR